MKWTTGAGREVIPGGEGLTSTTMVLFLSKHSSGPASGTQPDGPQSCLGTFLHSVSGVYFFTASLRDSHTWWPDVQQCREM